VTCPTIYISITDGNKHLAIDGHLELLKRFISTFVLNDDTQPAEVLEPGEPRDIRNENPSEAVDHGRG
jgi:hypothetical protein